MPGNNFTDPSEEQAIRKDHASGKQSYDPTCVKRRQTLPPKKAFISEEPCHPLLSGKT